MVRKFLESDRPKSDAFSPIVAQGSADEKALGRLLNSEAAMQGRSLEGPPRSADGRTLDPFKGKESARPNASPERDEKAGVARSGADPGAEPTATATASATA